MDKSPFSLKGLGIGTLLCLGIGVVAPYAAVFSYHRIGFNPSSPGALFFFACVIFANIVVAFLGRRLALSKPDLVLIYCMLLMAVTVPTWGLMFFLIGTLVYPFYFATPENRFEDLFFDYIPQWMVPRDPEAIKGYYEGLPRGTPIPWEVWVEPMAWWLGLVVVMGFMLICLSGIPTPTSTPTPGCSGAACTCRAFGWLTSSVWFSALIAWVLKAVILHVGGGKLFRTLKPFFLGLILGEVLTAGAWVVVYSLTVEYGRVLSIM